MGKNQLVSRYLLQGGDNNIKMIIKKEIINLGDMFCNCKVITNIKELEFLDTSNVIVFSNMFDECSYSLIKDLKVFRNWNVSN